MFWVISVFCLMFRAQASRSPITYGQKEKEMVVHNNFNIREKNWILPTTLMDTIMPVPTDIKFEKFGVPYIKDILTVISLD